MEDLESEKLSASNNVDFPSLVTLSSRSEESSLNCTSCNGGQSSCSDNIKGSFKKKDATLIKDAEYSHIAGLNVAQLGGCKDFSISEREKSSFCEVGKHFTYLPITSRGGARTCCVTCQEKRRSYARKYRDKKRSTASVCAECAYADELSMEETPAMPHGREDFNMQLVVCSKSTEISKRLEDANLSRRFREFVNRHRKYNPTCTKCFSRKRETCITNATSIRSETLCADTQSSASPDRSMVIPNDAPIDLGTFVQKCAMQAVENDNIIDLEGVVKMEQSLSSKEIRLKIRDELLRVLGYQFLYIDSRGSRKDPNSARFRFHCSQDVKRKRKRIFTDGKKHKNCQSMERFNCSSKMHIHLDTAIHVAIIQIYHKGHASYVKKCSQKIDYTFPTLQSNQRAIIVSTTKKSGIFHDWIEENLSSVTVVSKTDIEESSECAELVMMQRYLLSSTSSLLESVYLRLFDCGKVMIFGKHSEDVVQKLSSVGFISIKSIDGCTEAMKPCKIMELSNGMNSKKSNFQDCLHV